jgi:hypothetical protein
LTSTKSYRVKGLRVLVEECSHDHRDIMTPIREQSPPHIVISHESGLKHDDYLIFERVNNAAGAIQGALGVDVGESLAISTALNALELNLYGRSDS